MNSSNSSNPAGAGRKRIESRRSGTQAHRTAKPAGAPEDAVLLTVPDLEAMAAVYQAQVIDNEALISQLSAIGRMYPRLVYVRLRPDSDIYPSAEAGLGAEGRGLVNAYMAGQLHAYRQVGELAEAGERAAADRALRRVKLKGKGGL
ncbi:MAG: hypothetical protein ACOC4K_00425 [Verrucomicrobiota bacterium]